MESKAQRTSRIVEDLGAEVYYDFNLKCVLYEATDEEVGVVERIVARARTERERIERKHG